MAIDETAPADSMQLPNFPAYLRNVWEQLNGAYIVWTIIMPVSGTLSVGTNSSFAFPMQTDVSKPPTVVSCAVRVKTAPTGQSIKVDFNKNGTTIFSNQSNRPEIAVSTNLSDDKTPDITTMAQDDVFTIDIDQVGSTIAGADLVAVIKVKQEVVIP
jgi:hypothetical protein